MIVLLLFVVMATTAVLASFGHGQEPLVQKEAAVLSSVHFTLIVSAFVAFHPFLPFDSMLSKSTMVIFRS